MKEEIQFSVQMTPIEIYKFTLYHGYHKVTGIFGVGLSLAALIILIVSFPDLSDQNKAVLTFVAAWFTILEPITLYFRAKSQLRYNKAYQKPLNYRLDQTGITVSQEDVEQTIAWEQLAKVVVTNSQLLVYSSKIHAFIFPKSAVAGEWTAALELVLYYAREYGLRMNGSIKRHQKKMMQEEG